MLCLNVSQNYILLNVVFLFWLLYVQVVADTSVSISELLPQLVIPVVKKECDMALAKHTDTVSVI